MSYVVKNNLLVPKKDILRPKKAAHIRVARVEIILRRPSWYSYPITSAVALDAAPGAGNNGNYQDVTAVNTVTYSGLTPVAPTLILGALNVVSTLTTPTMTWNGVSMSLIKEFDNGTDTFLYVFGLLNPASGNHNLIASWGGGTNSGLLTGITFKGTDISAIGTAVPNANIITLSQTVSANTADPNSPLAVTTVSGDAAMAFCASNPIGPYTTASTGTLDAEAAGAGAYNGWCGHNLAAGATTNIQFATGGGAPGNAIHIALRIQQPQSTAAVPKLAVARTIQRSFRGSASGLSPWRGGPLIPITVIPPANPDVSGQTIYRVRNQPWKW